MRKEVRENCIFSELHPAAAAIYYIFAIGITMFSNSPLLLAISLASAFAFAIYLKGIGNMIPSFCLAAVIMAVTMLINGFFTHKGSTILFRIKGSSITLEAIIYGAVVAMMLAAVIIWAAGLNVILGEDKIVYLFGKIAPTIGLVISMILRFIPLMRIRYKEIALGQKALGRDFTDVGDSENLGALKRLGMKIRRLLKQVSILISWSLENSIITADSMSARGFGLRGRTSYSNYRMKKSDAAFLILSLLLGMICVIAYVNNYGRYYFYPYIREISGEGSSEIKVVFYTAYVILMTLPIITEAVGNSFRRLMWKR